MGNCYSSDHIAEGHIHTDITYVTQRNHNALEQSVIDYWDKFAKLLYFQKEVNLPFHFCRGKVKFLRRSIFPVEVFFLSFYSF